MSDHIRTAIVTGAGKGIGAAIAKRLGADGFAVIVNYSSSASDAEAVVAAIEDAGGRARAVRANVVSAAEVKALFDAAEATFGAVDVLVNNAGILKLGPVAQVSDEDFQVQVAVNLTGSFNGMREGAKRIRDGGRIINLSTSIIGNYLPAHGVYVATKAAIEGLTHVLAKELGPRGVAVNAVAPGPVGTELFLTGRPPEMVQRITQEIPMGRLGEPGDIARVVSFLAGSDSGWVSGQIVKANGGRN
ncbi:MAG TPA: SDR family oxidoreductase [Rhodopila sp.]|jgi:3-oxoacyl-[acyl-carrier protein] reductase|nr:SDR family oxidoreductase [Rhodopila sp.]